MSRRPKRRPVRTACFLDFDHTLFQTDEFFHLDVREAFLRLDIDAELWEQSYEAVWASGYTLEKHVEEIARRSGSRLPLAQMRGILATSFSDLRHYLFPDVLPFLKKAAQQKGQLFLLSFGSPEWQRYKVGACGLAGYFEEVFFTPAQGGKATLVEQLVNRAPGPAIVVDNNPEELDRIRDVAPAVRTFWMDRVPLGDRVPGDEVSRRRYLEARRYQGISARHRHQACTSLAAIALNEREAD